MKLVALLKRSFITALGLSMVTGCLYLLSQTLQMPWDEATRSITIVFMVLQGLLFVIYWNLREEYVIFETIPTPWLIFLAINSSVSSLVCFANIINYFKDYTPCLIQKGNVLAYLLFLPVSVFVIALFAISSFIVFSTVKTLIERFTQTKQSIS